MAEGAPVTATVTGTPLKLDKPELEMTPLRPVKQNTAHPFVSLAAVLSEPAAKKRKVREKTPEEVAEAAAKREAKQKEKMTEKQRATETRLHEKEEKKAAEEAAKQEGREVRDLKKSIGDDVKARVQARERALSCSMQLTSFERLFGAMRKSRLRTSRRAAVTANLQHSSRSILSARGMRLTRLESRR